MTKQDDALLDDAGMIDAFGALSLVMLNEAPLRHAWRVNFVANFFIGPVYRQLDERFGVSRPEFVILYCLDQRAALVARDICRVSGLPKNSISRAVSDLLRKGLIEREVDPTDKRAKLLSLTEAGRRMLGRINPIMQERQARMRAVLGAEDAAEFDRLLRKVVYGMPDWVVAD